MYIAALLVVSWTVSQTSTQHEPKIEDIDEDKDTSDIYEDASVAFLDHCSLSEGMCGMSRCSRRAEGAWQRVARAAGGPDSDHTNLPNNRSSGFFMHSSTMSGQEGDSAWLESKTMTPGRTCNVQCLQFYYYHSGGAQDQLNIWIREFQDEMDSEGRLRLMGQITGPPSHHWLIHHMPLNAAGRFQVEFEVRKGAGNSTGGFSIDDINLSETECPDFTWQVQDFETNQTTSGYNTYLYSPRLYSKEGYAYQVALGHRGSYTAVYVRLVSGQYDDQLQWPCPWRQVTFVSLNQNPQIQLQMSEQHSITTCPAETSSDGELVWGNPREVGTNYTDENGEQVFANTLWGRTSFRALPDMKTRNFIEGGDAIFLFTFQDVSILENSSFSSLENSSLPCPKLPPVKVLQPREIHDRLPCTTKFITTTQLPKSTITRRTTTTRPRTTTTRPRTTTTRPRTTTTRRRTTTITRQPTTTTRPLTTTITRQPTTTTRPRKTTITRQPTTTFTRQPRTTMTKQPTTTITRQPTTTTRPRTTTITRQPTTIRRQPTTITRQPTTTNWYNHRQPTTTTTRPSTTTITRQPTTTVTTQPTTITRQPTTNNWYNHRQPTTISRQPITITRQPTTTKWYNHRQPTTTTTRPSPTTIRHTTTTTRQPTTTITRPRITTITRQPTTNNWYNHRQHTATTTRPSTTTIRRTTTTTRPRTTTTRRTTTTTRQPTTTTTRQPTTTTRRTTTTTTRATNNHHSRYNHHLAEYNNRH